MNPEYWKKVKVIIEEVLELTPEMRQAYLATACGADQDLRREVDSLLEFEKEYNDLIEDGIFSLVGHHESAEKTAKNLIGTQIGNYRIISELGAGGMGTVFLAERSDGAFEQQVALKLINQGTNSDAIQRRFFIERQILASLKHPNIAHLIDGGTTKAGLPYFVIEYVDGEPIIDYASRENLDLDERLGLFREVCTAVSFAHSNLVIHRDLKPSNILISREGKVKLLDFGIAKLLKPEINTEEAATATHNFVFTPEYASPEQVRGEKLTTATDIYSLGVILYELLTGNRPYKNNNQSIGEIIKAVCETEPERPSSVVSNKTKGNAQQTIPKSKIQNPKSLRGDLDNIILKALRKEKEHRYRSVEQLAEDIRRHQIGLPVTASRDTWQYRAAKFVNRNRVGVAATGLILLALIAGLAATIHQGRIARAEKAKAERRFNEVRRLAHDVLFDYHDAIAGLPGSTTIRIRLIKDAQRYLDNLAEEAAGDRALQREIASAYTKIGDVQGAASTTSGGSILSGANLGDTQAAFESYSKALAIYEQLILLEPNDQELAQDLAKIYWGLAETNISLGNLQVSTDYYYRGITMIERLLSADSSNKPLRVWLGVFYFKLANTLGVPGSPNLGHPEEALEYLKKAMKIDEGLLLEDPNNLSYRQALGTRYGNSGRIYYGSGNYSEALINYRKALEIGEQLVRSDATSEFYRRELALQYRNVGNALLAIGDKNGAIEHLNRSIARFEELMAADAKDTRIRRSAAYGYRDLGVANSAADQGEQALKNFKTALNIFTELSEQDSKNVIVKHQLAVTRLKMSEFFVKIGDAAQATENARQSIYIGEKLVADGNQDFDVQKTLTDARAQLEKCLLKVKK
ncbi:MAG TPA: serine/threonine-protein kinase [Pyrinomonadaceae bacterium]|nr:serine/threonine-protein kinase [Pyrinomonadaceae bacterium]